jgi:hypothetical protein
MDWKTVGNWPLSLQGLRWIGAGFDELRIRFHGFERQASKLVGIGPPKKNGLDI